MTLAKVIIEGLGLGIFLYIVCAVGIRNGAVGMVHLYSDSVQNRVTQLGLTTPEKIRTRSLLFKAVCMEIVVDWTPMKMLYGCIDMNTEKGVQAFSKMMHKNADWARRHPEDVNTWDFHFDEALHQDGFYYQFTHCPIADFCKKYGLEEINPVLCNIDFMTMAMMHSVLHREHTIAEGGKLCDYWTVGNKITDPR